MAIIPGRALFVALALAVPAVLGHGVLLTPISRAVRQAANTTEGVPIGGSCPQAACEWYTQQATVPATQPTTICDPKLRTMGVNCASPNDFPCTAGEAVPWCAPGSAPVKSACGVFAGGLGRNSRDMLDLDRTPQATWTAGSVADVMYALTANHGGGFSYRLCPHSEAPTEECFQQNHLKFHGDTQYIVGVDGKVLSNFSAIRTDVGTFPKGSQWTRNPIPQEVNLGPKIPGLETTAVGRGPFPFGVLDKVEVPQLPEGDYVLSWRWDAEQTKQVWSHCSDVHIVNPASKQPDPLPPTSRPVCIGGSIGLDVAECSAWVDFYDALGGANWPTSWSAGCDGRLDPCGCGHKWQKSVRCTGLRDFLHISEIYVLGAEVVGKIPASIKDLTELKALSIVESNLTGPLPEELGQMPNLIYIWLDHNSKLDGPVPQSFVNMTQLYALELHQNSMTGTLPSAGWKNIEDCAMQGNTFACPLPEGALACGASCA